MGKREDALEVLVGLLPDLLGDEIVIVSKTVIEELKTLAESVISERDSLATRFDEIETETSAVRNALDNLEYEVSRLGLDDIEENAQGILERLENL